MQRFYFEDEEQTIELTNVIDFAGLDAAAPQFSMHKGYKQDGVTMHDVSYDARRFSIQLDIRGDGYEAAAAARRELMAFFGKKTAKRFVYRRGTTELYLEDVYMAAPFETGGRERRTFTGLLQFIATNPYFQRPVTAPSMALETALYEYPEEGMEFIEGGIEYSSVQNAITVVNRGTVPSPALIRLYGAAAAPAITNNTTGQTFALKSDKSIAEGEILEIDSKTARVEIIDDEGERHLAFNYIDDDPDKTQFIMLAPGENSISFEVSGGSVGYIEVAGYEYYTNI